MAQKNEVKSGFVQTHNTEEDDFTVVFCSFHAVNVKGDTWKGHYGRGI